VTKAPVTRKPTTDKPGTPQPTIKLTTRKPTTIKPTTIQPTNTIQPTTFSPTLSTQQPTLVATGVALQIVGPLSFDGTKSYYGYGSFKPPLGSAFTLSMWITQSAASSEQYLATLGRTPKNFVGEFILQLLSNNAVKYWEYGSAYGIVLTSSNTVTVG